jgi:hypothetical protein
MEWGRAHPRVASVVLGAVLAVLGGLMFFSASVIGWFVGPVLIGLGYGIALAAPGNPRMIFVGIAPAVVLSAIFTFRVDFSPFLIVPIFELFAGLAFGIAYMRKRAEVSLPG